MTAFVLQQLEHYIPYCATSTRVVRRLIKALLSHWSTSPSQSVRLLAFVRLRQIAMQLPFPAIEQCLKVGPAHTHARTHTRTHSRTRTRRASTWRTCAPPRT